MEHENKYTSQGQGALNTVLGAIGTAGATGILGNVGGIFGGGANSAYTRYDAEKDAKIAALETEVKLRDANTFTLGEIGKLRDYMEHRFDKVEREICDQKVYNATNNAVLSCVQGQVAELLSLTKRVVPNGSICPGWGEATVSVSTTTA